MTDEMLRMMQLAQQGFHCSQILLFMGLEAQGKTNEDLIRAMSGLAGGIGFSGDVCGALTGAACLLGLYTGKGKPQEEEDAMLIVMVAELMDWFSKEYGQACGGIRCETILADDLQNKSTRCPALVLRTYEKAKALLLENGYDLASGRP
ncbi:MAG TPA: C-GCAxxG-C-C family protein [Thermodesulfobacteriota bacterium]|nr:C-GCAxxG-C-C family protein [Thermodesulfobacteriota bacterium]HNU72354.1 C-GCAxxG-C-C family protein [Thermodesulfobacteriota bacterium]HQO79376.1 C-GCAxxG-C-C family protein [Thermodesulfobacteriota bacterium]